MESWESSSRNRVIVQVEKVENTYLVSEHGTDGETIYAVVKYKKRAWRLGGVPLQTVSVMLQ